jgi:hypothetical protein
VTPTTSNLVLFRTQEVNDDDNNDDDSDDDGKMTGETIVASTTKQ